MLPDVQVGSGGLRRLMDYCILLACLMVWVTSATTIMGDECDWTGSGLTSGSTSSRSVTPVYLRCTAGRITWKYPRGALHVLLRLPGADREFRACLKLHPDEGVKVPARLFLEGPRSLLPLYSNEDGGNRKTRCFNSKNGQVAIYVEATEGDAAPGKRVADFEYDLQPLPRGSHSFDKSEECRPCTAEELAHAFCTSDLVTRGTMRGVENRDDLDISQMLIKITKIIRHTAEDNAKDILTNSIDGLGDFEEVTLNVPQKCGVTHGLGEFVFMARRKLGDLTLQCAPRLEDWAMLVNTLMEQGKAHCVLSS